MPRRRLLVALAASLGACTPHGDSGVVRRDPVVTPPPELPVLFEPPPEPPPVPELLPAPEPAVGPRCFPGRVDIALGEWPLNGDAGDLDGDGDLDVLVNYSLAETIEVLRSDGQGGLLRGEPQRLEASAVGVTLGDFNGDGRPDLAAASYRGDDVRVYLGEGEGRFQTRGISTRVKRHVGGGAVGDLDGDGRLDLVVPLWSAAQVLLGDGRGGFRLGAKVSTGQAPEGPRLVDVTGDGRLDLAVPSNDDHHLAVFAGGRGGGLKAIARHPCGQGGAALEAFDLEGDGDLDLAMANIHSDDVCVFVGDGRGRFTFHAALAVGGYANAVRAADLDHDGHVDLAALAWDLSPKRPTLGDGVVRVFFGDGQGGLREGSSAAVGASPNELWLSDLNDDGALEAITLNSNGRSITVLRGDGCVAS